MIDILYEIYGIVKTLTVLEMSRTITIKITKGHSFIFYHLILIFSVKINIFVATLIKLISCLVRYVLCSKKEVVYPVFVH